MSKEIEDTINKPGVVVDRWILRLGKDSDEAGKFVPWFLPNSTFEQDLESFLACLNLLKLHEAVKERMSQQKKGVREAKKVQRETQKALDKATKKAKRAAEKAQLKLDRAAERERIKAEAKKTREEAKLAKRTKLVDKAGRIEGQLVLNELPNGSVPRKAEDTPATPVATAPVVQAHEGIPVRESIRVLPEGGVTNPVGPVVEEAGKQSLPEAVPVAVNCGILEEGSVTPRVFMIPEEG